MCRVRWRNPPMLGCPGCATYERRWETVSILGRSTAGTSLPGGQSLLRSIRRCGAVASRANGAAHDAYSVAAWMRRADRDGSLAGFLDPPLAAPERTVAQIQG